MGIDAGRGVGSLNLTQADAGPAMVSFIESCPRLTTREDGSGLTRGEDWRTGLQRRAGLGLRATR